MGFDKNLKMRRVSKASHVAGWSLGLPHASDLKCNIGEWSNHLPNIVGLFMDRVVCQEGPIFKDFRARFSGDPPLKNRVRIEHSQRDFWN